MVPADNSARPACNQKSNKNRLYSPQHKIITSIKKKKYLDDSAQCELNKKQKTAKKEIDVYELEVINQVLYNDEDSQGKNKKSGKLIEQMHKTDPKNALRNDEGVNNKNESNE